LSKFDEFWGLRLLAFVRFSPQESGRPTLWVGARGDEFQQRPGGSRGEVAVDAVGSFSGL